MQEKLTLEIASEKTRIIKMQIFYIFAIIQTNHVSRIDNNI